MALGHASTNRAPEEYPIIYGVGSAKPMQVSPPHFGLGLCNRESHVKTPLLHMGHPWLLGGALLGTSLWMYLDGASIAPVTKDIEGYNYVLFFLMAVGGVMFIMGFLGCCGAFQESQCMLATFFALVLVLFAGQIAAGIWLKTNEPRFTSLAENSLAQSIQHDYGFNELKTEAFDIIQSEVSRPLCRNNFAFTDMYSIGYKDQD
ncbi:cd9 antigen [Halocaridina rubra]|uniref:Cd9 antigen n=1 Tax=Halocaridina rubra TaxID=373956 RepID=A0AAN8X2K2_HALRR